MLAKRIIPCLDIKNGRIVKGTNFLNLKDAGDPVEISHFYSENGADEITILDITATLESRSTTLKLISKITDKTFVPITVGGGINTLQDIENLLNHGADKVSINSGAIQNPQLIEDASKRFGSQCIVVAIDVKKYNNQYMVYTHGGRKMTSLNAVDWAKKAEGLGAGEILLTSMDNDGTQQGFECTLTSLISGCTHIPVIASGGVGKIEHFIEGVQSGKADALLAASLFHFKLNSIMDVKIAMHKAGIPVRIEPEPI